MSARRTLGIAGTGLIGGSIGLRARESGYRVIGYDSDGAAADRALRLGILDERVERAGLYGRSDIVVLAMPVRAILAELAAIAPHEASGPSLIMDVASVKAPVVRAARGLQNFVAAHPMAGNEHSGPEAAAASLFEGAPWAYVPCPDPAANALAVEFIGALGAAPTEIDANVHDAVVACTSHMPQVIAWLFADRIGQLDAAQSAALLGPVARELLRIGARRPPMWNDVLEFNAANLARELRAMAGALDREADRYILKTP